MNHKEPTSLLSAKIGTDSSNYVNHQTSWSSPFICDDNENVFMKRNQGSLCSISRRFLKNGLVLNNVVTYELGCNIFCYDLRQKDNPISYITSTYDDFNFLSFFQLYCATKTTSESISLFKIAIQDIKAFDQYSTNAAPPCLLYWCKSTEKNDYEVLQSDLLKSLWSLKDTASATKNFVENYHTSILNEISNILAPTSSSSSNMNNNSRKRKANAPPPPPPPAALIPRIECGPVLFGSFSVSTILEKDALDPFLKHKIIEH